MIWILVELVLLLGAIGIFVVALEVGLPARRTPTGQGR